MIPDLTGPRAALAAIRWAHGLIRGSVHRTPLLECRSLTARAGVPLRLKCENLQRAGSFKLRGALVRALNLSERDRVNGIVTWSSGNHAQGVALAARLTGTRATVVMPEDANPLKVAATRGYGAEIVFAGRTSEERRQAAARLAGERGLVPVPPFDDPYIVCGQGTVGLEVMEEWPDARAVFVPIGGGGLVSGVALSVKALGLGTRVVGVEPAGADRAARSLAAGRRVRLEAARTIADGLRPLELGELNWDVIRRHVDEVVTVTDPEIAEAVRLLLERAKLVAEPSGAASVAAALREAHRFGGPAVAIVSGGNIDLSPIVARLLPASA